RVAAANGDGGGTAGSADTASGPTDAAVAEEPGRLDISGFLYLAVIFAVSIGTIYLGLATPTEAASFGAFAALIILLLRTRPPAWLHEIKEALTEAIGLTAMTFLLMVGAGVFTYVLALSGASSSLVGAVTDANLPPYLVLVLCLIILLPLGMFLDGISMILIAAPLLHPILTGYGFDGIWIGVLIVKVAEMALITPPVGMNAFVYSGAVREAGLGRVFRGVVPFIVADLVVVALLIAFPAIVTFLPSMSAAQ
ncbi:MAG: TRAP transporter large permease subunit, partial [Mycobacterium sp.]